MKEINSYERYDYEAVADAPQSKTIYTVINRHKMTLKWSM